MARIIFLWDGAVRDQCNLFVPIDVSVLIMTMLWVCGPVGKESACNVGDLGSIPGLGRSPGERKGYPLQHSDLENSMDCLVHAVAELDTPERVSLHFTSGFMLAERAIHLVSPYQVYPSSLFIRPPCGSFQAQRAG